MNELTIFKNGQKTFMALLVCTGLFIRIPVSTMTLGQKSNQIALQSKVELTGIVTDTSGEPIIGASVRVKGSQTGTITDLTGKFVLSVNANDILIVSYVGFQTQDFTLNGKTNVDVVLKENSKSLGEVVVVGFGTQKKVNLTGSLGIAMSDELESRPVNSATQPLQGLVPGLNISTSTGYVNSTIDISVRGIGTIGDGSSGSPLILIDGMEGDLNTINPQDIENISVLKDAAASSIYGSRAPFGVYN